MATRHPEETKAEARRRVAEGESVGSVARTLGLARETVSRWVAPLGHVTNKGARDPQGRWLKGTSPNPSGSSSNLERARLMLEDAAPQNVQRLLDHVQYLEVRSVLELPEMFRSKEYLAAIERTLKPLLKTIEARAQADALKAQADAERVHLEAERAGRFDLSLLTDEEADLLERLHAKAKPKL